MISKFSLNSIFIFFLSIAVYIHVGQAVTLTCNLSTSLIPMWKHPDKETINFQNSTSISNRFRYKDRFTVLQDGSIKINATRYFDAGEYVCTSGAENQTLHLFMTN